MPHRSSIAPCPPLSTVSPVALSAQGLHELAIQAFRVGNRGRLSLCEALRALSETRLYFDLGFPSLAAYADAFFQLRRSETFEHVRVAKALVELTDLREAFGQGRVGWSALKAITRVASLDSQAEWIDFARKNGVERTLAEARDALRHRRDTPRDSSFGLPNLDQKLVLRFSRSDMDKVRKWIEGACATVAESSGADEVSLEQAVLFLCEKAMINRAQIVYQHCPDCRRARVGTRDGFVEVAPAEIERYEGSAEQVVIDGPTPPKLRRRVLAREAGRCGNPRCRHRADHCHHIVFRSRGGKTELANEVAVCSTCHALVHAGLLRVRGRANDELRWSPIVGDDSLKRAVASERAAASERGGATRLSLSQADRLPVLQFSLEAAKRETPSEDPRESANADAVLESGANERLAPASDGGFMPTDGDGNTEADGAVNRDDLAHGLMRLGVPAKRSRRLIDAAIAGLPRTAITEANVLRSAIRSL